MTTPEGQQQPADRVVEAWLELLDAIKLPDYEDGIAPFREAYEAAIRADERWRLAALCAWCGHEPAAHFSPAIDFDVPVNGDVCYGGDCPPHAYETTASALARLKEALREADRLLEGMWSFSEEARAGLVHTWFVRASDVLRAALAEPQGGGE